MPNPLAFSALRAVADLPKNKFNLFSEKVLPFQSHCLTFEAESSQKQKGLLTKKMAYYVDHTTLSVKQSSCGTDFQTEQAAQNALADYIRLNTTYGIDVDPDNFGVVSGGPYRDFLSAKNALIEFAIAAQAQVKGHAVMEAIAETFYLRALDARNPNESTAFESMGFAPHGPLTALNL